MLSLRARLAGFDARGELTLRDRTRAVGFQDLARGTSLSLPLDAFAGRAVLLAVREQWPAALAMVALDGVARRLVLAPPDLSDDQLAAVARDAEIDIVATDGDRTRFPDLQQAVAGNALAPATMPPTPETETEWVLATSGTTGAPKLVAHTLAGLAGAIDTRVPPARGTAWSTFYDIRRYGGLQVFLRAMLGPAPLVLSDSEEASGDYLGRAASAGVTHILGTPSHWRRALMSPALGRLTPRYVRLSGEIADQAILDRLRTAFPDATVAHAYASTEAGVGFSVEDGREGFPAGVLGARDGTEIVVRDERLHVRSARTGRRYLGSNAVPLIARDGFVDTGDRVEHRDGRYYFLGRASGIINVGGAKVQPEEVEAVLASHARVEASRVSARKNPVLGALVVAEVVLRHGEEASPDLRDEILAHCRAALARHKVPARLTFVDALPLSTGGKLLRAPA